MRGKASSRPSVWRWPGWLAALIVAGLLMALLGQGEAWRAFWLWAAWSALGVPLLVVLIALCRAGAQIACRCSRQSS